MKKIIAMLLALIMVCSLATVAFAADGDTGTSTGPVVTAGSKPVTTAITLNKLYIVTGATAEGLFPDETLTFDVNVLDGWTNPENTEPTVNALEVNGQTGVINVDIPAYNTVGVYKYVITEVAPTNETQGVFYSDEKMYLNVLVTYDYDVTDYDTTDKNYQMKAEIVVSADSDMVNPGDSTHHTPATGTNAGKYKLDTFTNYYDVGTLTVQKTVSGNLADKSALFEIKVTFESDQPVASVINYTADSRENAEEGSIAITDWEDGTAEVTLMLKHDATVTFTDIPEGVTYTVKEADAHLLAKGATVNANSDTDKDYTVTYTQTPAENNDAINNADEDQKKHTVTGAIDHNGTEEDVEQTSDTDNVVVSNEKKTSVETGVALDSAPYFLMLAVAVIGMVALVSKKRYEV